MENKFQTNFEIVRLYDENNIPPPVTKVGILPFVGGTLPPDIKLLLMKPKAEAKHLGAPAFQIAKGTRRININGNWCDMREDDLRHADESFYESLVQTALREGAEEIGLKPANVTRLYDMGGFTFTSASRGLVKPIHIFAASIADENDFTAFEATTEEARWLTLEEFVKAGRADHVRIAEEIVGRLESRHSPSSRSEL